MAANRAMFLWWGSGSCPSWKPMLVLGEKGLWEGLPNKQISFDKNEQRGADIMAVNQRGQVPTFKDGSLVVNESNAICMYLEEKYSNDSNRLLPASVEERSQPLIYERWLMSADDWNKIDVTARVNRAKTELGYWERTLTGRRYLVGDKFTMADVCCFPFVAFIVRLGAKLDEFPALRGYYEFLVNRPSAQQTWPPHWKEGPCGDTHFMEGL